MTQIFFMPHYESVASAIGGFLALAVIYWFIFKRRRRS